MMLGVYGQAVSVFPALDPVLVQKAVRPRSSDPDLRVEPDALIRATAIAVAKE